MLCPPGKEISRKVPAMLTQILKDHREKYNVTQEQLASDLNVDVRTLRRWENQETILRDKDELRRLASRFGVEAERFGVTNSSITDQQAAETLEHIWKLVTGGRAWEARTIAERLVGDLQTKTRDDNRETFCSSARASPFIANASGRYGTY